ncbi:MAG: VOC family protein [Bacteroidota bacterium]
MKRIEVLSIPVSDQQKAKDFYVNQLGLDVLIEAPFGEGQQWIQLGKPGWETSLTLVTWFENMQPGSLNGMVIESDDVAAERARLIANGVEVAPIKDTAWGPFAYFADPDGNQWALHQGFTPSA